MGMTTKTKTLIDNLERQEAVDWDISRLGALLATQNHGKFNKVVMVQGYKCRICGYCYHPESCFRAQNRH